MRDFLWLVLTVCGNIYPDALFFFFPIPGQFRGIKIDLYQPRSQEKKYDWGSGWVEKNSIAPPPPPSL